MPGTRYISYVSHCASGMTWVYCTRGSIRDVYRVLTVRALPSGRADRRGGTGERKMGSLRRRQEVRGNSSCTHSRVGVTGPVSR